MASFRSLAIFILGTFGFSWSLWALMMLSSRGLLPFHFPTNFLGSFGPLVGALLAGWLSREAGAVRGILRSLVAWRVHPLWYAVCLLGPAIVMALAAAAVSALDGAVPALQHLDRWYLVFPVGLLILLVGGPLGEEVGWRGYLQPWLQPRLGPLAASAVIAVVWFVWHMPLFWLEGAAQRGESLPLFGITILTFAVLFTWVYNRTGGSLLMAILFHTGTNTPSFLVSVAASALDARPLYQHLTLGLLASIALAVVVVTRGRLGQTDRSAGATDR